MSTRGTYRITIKDQWNENIIDLDPRYSFHKIVVCMSHEIIHAIQAKRGDLKTVEDLYLWKDKIYLSQSKSLKEFKKLPWEKEAFSNQYKVAKELKFRVLGISRAN